MLKGINMQMATFILAILEITKDTLTFGIILFTMVITFAQMFYTVLVPGYCAGENDDLKCKQGEYIFRVYTILLGDFETFERESFKTRFALVLLVFYSFMVIIVLLNVLIAIASDSYEKCLLKSQMLFGRARVMLIAELVCFQSLLLKQKDSGSTNTLTRNSKVFNKWWVSTSRIKGWSHGSLAFFGLSSLVILLWAIGELAGTLSGERYGSVGFSLLSILINILVFSGMMVFFSQGADSFFSKRGDLVNSDSEESDSWLPSCLQKCMLRVMGSSQDSRTFSPERIKNSNEWQGRVHHIQSKIDQLTHDSFEHSMRQAQELEQMVASTEARLKSEMVALDQRVESMSTCLLFEIRQLHESTLNRIQGGSSPRRSGEHED